MGEEIQEDQWSAYESNVRSYLETQASRFPGYFSSGRAQRYYDLCREVAVPLERMPVLSLPVRVHLIRSDHLGCSGALNRSSVEEIVTMVNGYWTQAGIRFHLAEAAIERSFAEHEGGRPGGGASLPPSRQRDVREFIDTQLTRGADGKMRNKGRRADIFLGEVLSVFDYRAAAADSFNVWFFDMIGQGSQGCHIDPGTRTVIMGERSTKGYAKPTRRPHECLAKTLAHELGHALGLGHPKGRVFSDGTTQVITRGEKNLMQGGSDAKGGGGDHLEQWQICLCRASAEKFLVVRTMRVRFGKRTVDFPSDDLHLLEDSNGLLSDPSALHRRMQRDGFLYLRGLIPRDSVLKARDAVLRHMDQEGALDPKAPSLDEGRMAPESPALVHMMGTDGIVTHPDVAAVLECPELFRFFRQYFGDSESARTFDYKWLRSVGKGEYTGAHMDTVYMSRGSSRLHTVWIPFGDVNVDQGTLVMCAGSNTSDGYAEVRRTYGRMDVDRDKIEGWLSSDPLELVDKFGGRWVTGNFVAGDVVIFGMHTLHASTTNLTDRYRLSCDVRFQPESEEADPRWAGRDGSGHTAHGVVKLKPMSEALVEWGL